MARIQVPQEDGTITINNAGDITEYEVSGGMVDVDDNDVQLFLNIIDDATLVDGPSAEAKPASDGEE